jgi:hypothetical protein
MSRIRTWRLPLAVLAVAGMILLAGGVAVGSNMGFKLNKPLAGIGTGEGQIGNNWTSIPYNNPYGKFGPFCTQTGLPTAPPALLERLDSSGGIDDGKFFTQNCADAVNPVNNGGLDLVPGDGVRIRLPIGAPATSIIIVGSHNPTLQVTIQAVGGGQKGNKWFAVPYHTTAVNFNDVCVQAGIPLGQGLAESLDATTGTYTTKSCPSDDAKTTNLRLGEHIRLRTGGAAVTFIPAHF